MIKAKEGKLLSVTQMLNHCTKELQGVLEQYMIVRTAVAFSVMNSVAGTPPHLTPNFLTFNNSILHLHDIFHPKGFQSISQPLCIY